MCETILIEKSLLIFSFLAKLGVIIIFYSVHRLSLCHTIDAWLRISDVDHGAGLGHELVLWNLLLNRFLFDRDVDVLRSFALFLDLEQHVWARWLDWALLGRHILEFVIRCACHFQGWLACRVTARRHGAELGDYWAVRLHPEVRVVGLLRVE